MNSDKSPALISHEANQARLAVQKNTEEQLLNIKRDIDRIKGALYLDILFRCPLFYFYFNNINALTPEDLQKLSLDQLAALEMEVCLRKSPTEIKKFQSLLPHAPWVF